MLIRQQPYIQQNTLLDELFDKCSYLTEEEYRYDAIMVPIIENTEIGSNLLKVEDLYKFAEYNGIEDLGYAFSCISEANNLDPEDISFIVQDYNLILDEDLQDLCSSMINNNIPLYIIPIPSTDPISILGEMWLQTGDIRYLLEADEKKAKVNGPPPKPQREPGYLDKNGVQRDEEGNYIVKYYNKEGNDWYEYTKNFGNNSDSRDRARDFYLRQQEYTHPVRSSNPEIFKIGKTPIFVKKKDGKHTMLFQDQLPEDYYNLEGNRSGIRSDIDSHFDLMSKTKTEEEFKKIQADTVTQFKNWEKHADQSFAANGGKISGDLQQFYKHIESQQFPKSWLAKKIAWFRSLYAKFMHKNTIASQGGVTGFLKKIGAMILKVIDKLAEKLQNAVN